MSSNVKLFLCLETSSGKKTVYFSLCRLSSSSSSCSRHWVGPPVDPFRSHTSRSHSVVFSGFISFWCVFFYLKVKLLITKKHTNWKLNTFYYNISSSLALSSSLARPATHTTSSYSSESLHSLRQSPSEMYPKTQS